MKFDSYTRFLKSQLYQECILAEVEGRSLPDAQQVPSSPASKHSVSSEHSSVSTPKKVPAPWPCPLREGSCPVGSKSRGCWDAAPTGTQPPARMQPPIPRQDTALLGCSTPSPGCTLCPWLGVGILASGRAALWPLEG